MDLKQRPHPPVTPRGKKFPPPAIHRFILDTLAVAIHIYPLCGFISTFDFYLYRYEFFFCCCKTCFNSKLKICPLYTEQGREAAPLPGERDRERAQHAARHRHPASENQGSRRQEFCTYDSSSSTVFPRRYFVWSGPCMP